MIINSCAQLKSLSAQDSQSGPSGNSEPFVAQWQQLDASKSSSESQSTSGGLQVCPAHHAFMVYFACDNMPVIKAFIRQRVHASMQTGRRGVAVDGVPEATVDAWFAEADSDGDGRISGLEAKEFFLRTNLPKQALSKVPSGCNTPAIPVTQSPSDSLSRKSPCR